MVARGAIPAESEDWVWWNELDYLAAIKEATAHAERVNRGDGVATDCRWMDGIG